MAIQLPNFLGHGEQTPDYSPISNLLGNILRGYQTVKAPAQMERQAQSEELANALKQLQLQHAPSKMGLEEDLLRTELQERRLKSQMSNMELQRLKAFRALMGSDKDDEIGLPKDTPHQRPQEGMTNVVADAANKQIGEVGSPSFPVAGEKQQPIVINQGDKRLHKVDQMYMNHPEFRDLLEKQGYKLKREIKSSPETGQVFSEITYPSGRVEVQSINVGKNKAQLEREANIGKADAKVYDNSLEAQQTAQGAIDNLDYIKTLIGNSDDFKKIVGPVKSILAKWTGRPEDKELLGNIESAVGNIVLDAAKSIKGAFTGRDLGLINSIKPNTNDFPEIFIGKLNAMRQIAELVSKRNQLISDYIRQDYTPTEAIKMARNETQFPKYESLFKQKTDKEGATPFTGGTLNITTGEWE